MAQWRVPIWHNAPPPPPSSTPGGEQRVPLGGPPPNFGGGTNPPPTPPPPPPAPPPATPPPSTDGSGSSNSGSGSGSGDIGAQPGGGGGTIPGAFQPAPLPSNPVTTPNEQIGNPDNPVSLSFAQVENYWIQAGGSPQAASMAAAVADAESGLNAQATRTNPDGSTSVGLWLIPANGTPPGSTDPIANARAAVQLSQGGTDWTQWCSTWSDNNCGQNNGTYLGQGANALMSLATQKPGASYNVFGSTPAGSGVGAGAATGAGGTSTPATPSSKLPMLIGGLVLAVIVIFFVVNRKKRGQDTTSGAGQDVEVNNPSGTGDVYVPAHMRHRSGT